MSESTSLEAMQTPTAGQPPPSNTISDLMNAILDADLNDQQCGLLKNSLNEIIAQKNQSGATPGQSYSTSSYSATIKPKRAGTLSTEGKNMMRWAGAFVVLIGLFLWALPSDMMQPAPTAAAPATPAATPPAAAPAAPTPAAPATPAATATPPAATPVHHKRAHVAHVAALTADGTPPVAGAPKAPFIDEAVNQGSTFHLAWKPVGVNIRYKVYGASNPQMKNPSSIYLFRFYRTYVDWTVSSMPEYRYAAVSAIDDDGKESALSNSIDTTP